MPSVDIDYTAVEGRLSAGKSDSTQFISTPDGLALLEIQGTLNLPSTISSSHEVIDLDTINKLIKFGSLQFDGTKLVLFIGTSQRLLGNLETMDPPLALLQFPVVESGDVEVVKVIDRKLVFKNRPLPIM